MIDPCDTDAAGLNDLSGTDATQGWTGRFAAALDDPGQPPPSGLRAWNTADLRARLAIYRNNALVPVVAALEQSLPASQALAGAPAFRRLLIGFVRTHPPSCAVLQDYGEQLPDYVEAQDDSRLPGGLVALLRFELLQLAVWHAPDAPTLAPAHFAALLARPEALPGLRFTLHPATRVFAARHAVASLWLAQQRGEPLPCSDATRPETVLLTRSDWAVEVRVIDAGAATLLRALAAGATLGEALADALDAAPQREPATLLALLLDSGAVSRIDE